jgi:glycosyltransferase involved in cell wall biosynthesis
MRVAVSQRYLPHYRVVFFEEVQRLLRERGGSLQLFYSLEMGKVDAPPEWSRRIKGWSMELPLAEIPEKALFAPGLAGHLTAFRPDVVVLEDLSGLANSLFASLYCRLFSKPYLIWGLGNVPRKKRSRLRTLLSPFIKFLYSGSAGFICYSSHAREVYSKYGKPTFVAPNAYLPRMDLQELEAIKRSIDCRYRENVIRLVSIGAFKTQKRFDVLLKAISSLSDINLELHLIGDGLLRNELQRQCADLGLQNNVFFHGALYDRDEKVQIFRESHLGIMPGRGGLAIQELMAHGIPVISGIADGTESDLICNGRNGYLVNDFLSPEDIALQIREFMFLRLEEKRGLAEQALETVLQLGNIETMAQGFVEAIAVTSLGTVAAHEPVAEGN